MVQVDKLKAILALLYEIAELERALSPDHAKIDRLKAKLRDLLAEDGDRGERTSERVILRSDAHERLTAPYPK